MLMGQREWVGGRVGKTFGIQRLLNSGFTSCLFLHGVGACLFDHISLSKSKCFKNKMNIKLAYK